MGRVSDAIRHASKFNKEIGGESQITGNSRTTPPLPADNRHWLRHVLGLTNNSTNRPAITRNTIAAEPIY